MPEEPKEVSVPYIEKALPVAQPMFCFGYKLDCDNPETSMKEKVCTALLLNLIAGDASELYKRLINKGLINDEFSFEHFTGYGYRAVIFEGESSDPKQVAEEIKAEITALKEKGINKKLFAAVRRAMYGDAIRVFNNVEGIAMQLCDCAMGNHNLFDEIKYLKSITADDVLKRLNLLENDKTVLSVINPN